jgi:hypothetical protein
MIFVDRRKNWIWCQIRKWRFYLRRRVINYRHMIDEMDALRREIQECDKSGINRSGHQ